MKLRKILHNTMFGAAVYVAALHIYDGLANSDRIQYLHYNIYSAKVPSTHKPYRIAFVTDVHNTPPTLLRQVASEITRQKPDLLLLGGDFSENRAACRQTLQILGTIPTTNGILGVMGNHDSAPVLYAEMRRQGMVPLYNNGISVTPFLYIGGVADLKTGRPNIVKSFCNAKEQQFRILLSHNPDVTMEQPTQQVDFALCGHIHGGEISFFGAFAPILATPYDTRYGQRFAKNWATAQDNTPVFTSNGIGRHAPLRMYAPPQVAFFNLCPQKENA